MGGEKEKSEERGEDFEANLAEVQQFLKMFVESIGVSRADVDDVVQSANIYMVENREKYAPGTEFRAWAATIARFRCLNYFRTRKRRQTQQLSEESLSLVADKIDSAHDQLESELGFLHKCLQRLPEAQRSLISDFYETKSNLKEFAERYNRSHVSMRKMISRIRQSLRKCIEGLAKGPQQPGTA